MNLRILERLGSQTRGFTGQVFLVRDKKKVKYKLRKCPSVKEAKRIESLMKKMRHQMPEYLGRDRQYLLHAYFAGQNVEDKLTLKQCREMGRLYAEVHQIEVEGSPEKNRDRFFQCAKELFACKAIAKTQYNKVVLLFKALEKSVGHHLALEFMDLTPANFMQKDKQMVFVDDEGIHISFKGSGLAKIYEKLNKKQQNAFFKGYESVAKTEWLTEEYHQFILLYRLILIVHFRVKKGIPLDRYKPKLDEFLKTRKDPFQ